MRVSRGSPSCVHEFSGCYKSHGHAGCYLFRSLGRRRRAVVVHPSGEHFRGTRVCGVGPGQVGRARCFGRFGACLNCVLLINSVVRGW